MTEINPMRKVISNFDELTSKQGLLKNMDLFLDLVDHDLRDFLDSILQEGPWFEEKIFLSLNTKAGNLSVSIMRAPRSQKAERLKNQLFLSRFIELSSEENAEMRVTLRPNVSLE